LNKENKRLRGFCRWQIVVDFGTKRIRGLEVLPLANCRGLWNKENKRFRGFAVGKLWWIISSKSVKNFA
jgi:hypothetical protein